MSTSRTRRFAAAIAAGGLLFALVGCSTSTSSGSTPASAKAVNYGLTTPGTITAAITVGDVPFATVDSAGKPTGMLVDLNNKIAKNMGLKVVYKSTDVNGGLAGLTSGTIDLMTVGLVTTPEREKTVGFTKPIFQGVNAVLVRTGSPLKTAKSLAGKRVGAGVGSNQYTYAQQDLKSATLVSESSNSSGLSQLIDGNLDALVIGSTQAATAIQQNPGKLKIIIQSPQAQPGAMAVNKKLTAFTKAYNVQLSKEVKNGTLLKLYDKYFDAKLLPYPTSMYKYWPEIKQQVAAQKNK